MASSSKFLPASINGTLVKAKTNLQLLDGGGVQEAFQGGDNNFGVCEKTKIGNDECDGFSCVRTSNGVC